MPRGLVLLPDNVDTNTAIARPPQELAKPETAKDDFEVSPTGLLVPKAQGITSPTQPKILLPTREQITTLAAQTTSETQETEKPEGNLAAFLYDPMAYLARKVMSEEHLGEDPNTEVTEIILTMATIYETRVQNQYIEAITALTKKIDAEGEAGNRPTIDRAYELEQHLWEHKKRALNYKQQVSDHTQVHGSAEPTTILSRTSTEMPYYDKNLGEQTKRVISSPGAMEEIAVAILEELDAPNIRKSYPEIQEVIEVLGETIKQYRGRMELQLLTPVEPNTQDEKQDLIKPEMPEVVKKFTGMLETVTTSPAVRTSIYDVMGQLDIPREYAETILQRMDRNHDLEHPLAFQLAVETARVNPDSAFIHEQDTKREKILAALQGNAQTCFDNFTELMALADGIVCSANLGHPTTGKVGIEIEFNSENRSRSVQYAFNRFLKGYEIGSNYCDDPPGCEVRKNKDALEHSLDYIEDALELRRTLADMPVFNHLSSLHIHLDQERHSVPTTLGGYLADNGNRELTRVNRREGKKVTFEIRGLVVPMDHNKELNVEKMDDAIDMLIKMAAVAPNPEGKIKLGEGPITNWKQIVFGHVCNLYESPEIRLACLKCLQDDQMLRGGMVEGLLNTYDIELLDKLSPEAFPGAHRDLESMKRSISSGKSTRELSFGSLTENLALNPQNKALMAKLLGESLEDFDLGDLMPERIMNVVMENPEISRRFANQVLTDSENGSRMIKPEYAALCMEIIERDQEKLEVSTHDKVNMAKTMLKHLVYDSHYFFEEPYRTGTNKVFGALKSFLGEDGLQEIQPELKSLFLVLARTANTENLETLLTSYTKFFEDNEIKFTDDELYKYLAESGGNSNALVLEHVFKEAVLYPQDHPRIIPLFARRLSEVGHAIYDWGDGSSDRQAHAYNTTIEAILVTAELMPEVYAQTAISFYNQASSRILKRQYRERFEKIEQVARQKVAGEQKA